MSPKVSKEHLEQRRANIMEAAIKVFKEIGYERTTMKHVMDEAEVSRGGLYQYFSNKEDLYEAILEEGLRKGAENTRELLENDVDSYWEILMMRMFGSDGKPDNEMDALASSTLEFFITGRNDEHRRKYAQKRYQLGLPIYQDVIEAGQKKGEFSDKYDSKVIAQTIISFIDGLALDYAILTKEEVKIKEQSMMFMEYLKLALGVKEN